MSLARRALAAFAILHAGGASFAIAQFLFFPERFVDLVPDAVPLADVRYALALFTVLPATFVAWDFVLLQGLRGGKRGALLVGFISGGAAIFGATLHAGFERWSTMAIDGFMGVAFLALTVWAWVTWPRPLDETSPRTRPTATD